MIGQAGAGTGSGGETRVAGNSGTAGCNQSSWGTRRHRPETSADKDTPETGYRTLGTEVGNYEGVESGLCLWLCLWLNLWLNFAGNGVDIGGG